MRLEVAADTGLRFHDVPRGLAPAVDMLRNLSKTVGIEYGDRLVVWHEIPDRLAEPRFPTLSYGPTLTLVYNGEEDRDEATNALTQFVSALVFAYEQAIELVPSYNLTASGEVDAFHPPVHRSLSAAPFRMLERAPRAVVVDPDAQLAVALYRQGVNNERLPRLLRVLERTRCRLRRRQRDGRLLRQRRSAACRGRS